MSRRAWIVVAIVAALVGFGCVIVTGSTDGYQPYPACRSASDCPDNTICCVDFSLAQGTVTQACRPSSEGCLHQLCATTSECQGSTCVQQKCSYLDASTDAFSACGVLVPSYCAPVGATITVDAAADAASE